MAEAPPPQRKRKGKQHLPVATPSQRRRSMRGEREEISTTRSSRSFKTHAGSLSLNAVYSEFLTVCFLPFVSDHNASCLRTQSNWESSGSLEQSRWFQPIVLRCQRSVSGSSLTFFATLNANLERPTRYLTPSSPHACMHASPSESDASCLDRLGSHPCTLATVSSRRATASWTHETWV